MSDSRNALLATGLSAHDAGDFVTAQRAYQNLLAADSLDIEANFFLGLLQLQTGAAEAAEGCLRRSVVLRPADSGSWNYLGLVRQQTACAATAAQAFDISLRCDPASDEAAYNAGIALRDVPDYPAAILRFRLALALNPSSWAILSNLGTVLRAAARLPEAREAFIRAASSAPAAGGPLFNIGLLLQDEGDWSGALAVYQSAAMLFKNDAAAFANLADAWRNIGILLTTIGRSSEARNFLEKALVVDPGALLSWNNYGNALKETRAITDARAAYARSLLIDPRHAEAEWNSALLSLLTGNLIEGFKLYESRWRVRELFPTTREFSVPRYSGSEPVEGRHVFLYAEEGLGDTLQFCRFSRRLLERGARVTLEVPAALVPLLRQSAVATEILARGDPEPVAELQSPLMSLPAAWGCRETDLHMDVPYLFADSQRVAHWGDIIQRDPGVLNVGICWRGGTGFRGDAMRSLDPYFFASLARRDDLVLYSLQKDYETDQVALDRLGIACFDGDFDSQGAFLDSIAVLAHLDLVITVDTSIAHLAAAAGKPTWVVLASVPDWRWQLDRSDSPWYPTARLFRQPAAGDWSGTFVAIERAIDEWMQSARAVTG
jgi:tetratricopeptide (TPR) repeat protein